MVTGRVTVDEDDPRNAAATRLGERVQAGTARIAPRPTLQRLVVEAVYDKSYAAAAAGAEAGDAMKVIKDVGELLDDLNVSAMPYKITKIQDLPSERPKYCPAAPPTAPMFFGPSGPLEVDDYLVAKRSADKKLWIMEDVADPPACGNTCQELLEAMGVPPEYGWLVRHGTFCCAKPQGVAANQRRLGSVEQKLLVVPRTPTGDVYPHQWLKLSLQQAASSGGAAVPVTMHVDPTCGQFGIDEAVKVWHDKSLAPPFAFTVNDTVPAADLGLLNEENFFAVAAPLVTDLQGPLQCRWLARILERLGLASRLPLAYVPARLVLEANGEPDEDVPPGAMLPAWVLSGSGPMPGLPKFKTLMFDMSQLPPGGLGAGPAPTAEDIMRLMRLPGMSPAEMARMMMGGMGGLRL
ncbi:hypothetical protein HYH03_000842 [Edaphochlamys debaryana]|uniref:Uncharacterized protein n=1 Tax=Edaphochlamys debaryana TaxID=47281 RepID=A0A835YFY6_9CHLO|nr:hypothetical protein HYH03_000842 [Edaphochlamys debaryana]|eukprot:KAG2501022.1 hypothetical protein HYH03_000842 [Edaphochlamys debaryana]